MKKYAAIDPGANGALCILTETGEAEFYDFAKVGLLGYVQALKNHLIPFTMVIVESVSAMPGQGVSSMFSFGKRLGELEGMLQTLGIGYDLVRPQAWQKICKVEPKSGKKGVYAAVKRLYPTLPLEGPKGAPMDGRCDALGMAHYARTTY